MDNQLAADVAATEVPLESLVGTAKSLALAAIRAGYAVRATRALGPRLPRQVIQPVVRTSSVAVVGVKRGHHFQAVKTDADAWDVIVWRNGWPVRPSNVTDLRAILNAQIAEAS